MVGSLPLKVFPMSEKNTMEFKAVSVYLPPKLEKLVASIAKQSGRSRSKQIIRMLESELQSMKKI